MTNRYPFADQITKSQLYSSGSHYGWPTLLATLTWMVELILCLDKLENEPETQILDPVQDISQQNDKIFYDFLTSK